MRKLTTTACLALLIAGAGLALAPATTQAEAQSAAADATTVLFDYDKDEVGPQAAASLDAFAAQHATGKHDSSLITIRGHADRDEAERLGGFPYVIGLSQRRATNVRAYLMTRGVPAGVMVTEAIGDAEPSSENSRAEQDRRVDLAYGPR